MLTTIHDTPMREGETPHDYTLRQHAEDIVAGAVQACANLGFNVTVEVRSVPPLAMRRYSAVVHVWKARK